MVRATGFITSKPAKKLCCFYAGETRQHRTKILGEQRKSPLNCERIQQMVKTSKFDAAEYLKTPAAIAAYLTEAFETDDAAYICAALDTAARAKGMANVAKATGLGRESLYKAFSGGSKPEFDTVRKVMGSFGVKLVAEPIEEEKKIA